MRRACHFLLVFCFFFFNDTATTEIYTLSLHDALPIWMGFPRSYVAATFFLPGRRLRRSEEHTSELQSRGLISYAVFCLKKKKKIIISVNMYMCFTHRVIQRGALCS